MAYVATLVSYFGVGLPLSITFAFRFEWDILGLCLGLAAGCYCYLLTTSALVACINWDTEVKRARDRRLGQQREYSTRIDGSGSSRLAIPRHRQASEGKGMADERKDYQPAQQQEEKEEGKEHGEESKEVDVEAPRHCRELAKQSKAATVGAPPQGHAGNEEHQKHRGTADRANLAFVTIRLEEEEEGRCNMKCI